MGKTKGHTNAEEDSPASRDCSGQPEPPRGLLLASSRRLIATTHHNGVEDPDGVLDAVVRAAGSPEPVRIEPRGFLLAATLESARTVLTRPDTFVLPFDARRRSAGADRVSSLPILSPSAVELGRETFGRSLTDVLSVVGATSGEIDPRDLVRDPVSWSTTASLLPDVDTDVRDHVARAVVGWVDSLGPVISAFRPPRRWSRIRRAEQRAWSDLLGALRDAGCEDPALTATGLAAGVQVPMAAGVACLTVLASDAALHRQVREDDSLVAPMVWEILRLFPPTWLLPRITNVEVVLSRTSLAPHTAVVVSPVALGRLDSLVPGPELHRVDPHRWSGDVRPGAWLPFGAGPHACPGRNLGLAQLCELVRQMGAFDLGCVGPQRIDTDRGLSLSASGITLRRQELNP